MFGIDYSTGRPSHSAMKAAGAKFIVRYIGSTNHTASRHPKFITPSEYTSLKAAGFEVVLVFEQGAQNAAGGRSAGRMDAATAKAELKYLGLPANYPVYYAVDWNTPYTSAIDAYFVVIGGVMGVSQVGCYGGLKVIKGFFDKKRGRLGWQTLAWSPSWDTRAQLRQTEINKTIGGQSVDYNEAQMADYGQKPVSTTKGNDMPVFAGTIAPGETITLSVPLGSVKAFGLAYDNPKPAKLRVAFHYKAGHGEVFPDLMVGGKASDTDSWPGKTSKGFAHPEKGDWVSITYYPNSDPNAGKVGWDLGLV